MADDFDNTDEIANLSDDELKQYVYGELRSQNAFDVEDIDISVSKGAVTLTGSVGTEAELRIVDHVMTDVVGLTDMTNNLVIDEIRRAQSPEAIDEHIASEEERGGLLGDESRPYTAESEHLADESLDDSLGTHDVTEAIENAEPWIPPESPTPEGVASQDQGGFGADGEH